MNLLRQPWETPEAHIERVLADDLFDSASSSEVAAFCDCEPALVEKVRGVRRVFEHAEQIRDRIGWPFDEPSLICVALERYAARFAKAVRRNG